MDDLTLRKQRDDFLTNVEENKDNEFYKMLSEQFSNKNQNLEFITELSDRDIMILIRLGVLYEWSGRKVDILPYVMEHFKSMRVSLKRQGRKELFESFRTQLMGMFPEMQPGQSNGGIGAWFRSRRS